MGDSADLIVLGAYFGSGSKGGKMSVFLMGVYDEDIKKFKTVVRVGNGFTDAEIDDLQTSLPMTKISGDPTLVPDWLLIFNPMVPDFVVKNPRKAPVWEISGAEFTATTRHTSQIGIRFPRVKRVRDDKDWMTATNLIELKALFDLGGINRPATKGDADSFSEEEPGATKTKSISIKTKQTKIIDIAISKKLKGSSDDSCSDEDYGSPKKKNSQKQSKRKIINDDSSEEDNVSSSVTIKEVNGTAIEPLGSGRKIIIHFCDNSGRWPSKGFFCCSSI